MCLILLCGCAGTLSTVGRSSDKASAQIFPLSTEVANKILATAMAGEFAGSAISRVEFPHNGYQATIRFGLDSHTIVAYMIPAKGRSGTGEVVPGYVFEVSHSGTRLLAGPISASSLFERIVHDATLKASPLPLIEISDSPTHQTPVQKSASSQGTGFIVGLGRFSIVVTNYHIINEAKDVEITFSDGHVTTCKVLKRDKQNDLAIISLDDIRQKPIGFKIFPSHKVSPGQEVFVIGFPMEALLGGQPGISKGMISSIVGLNNDSRHFRITAQINPGNSGGPLLDAQGRVIGIVSHKLNQLVVARTTGQIPEGTNFAIKSTLLLNLYPDLERAVDDKEIAPISGERLFSMYSKAVVVVRSGKGTGK